DQALAFVEVWVPPAARRVRAPLEDAPWDVERARHDPVRAALVARAEIDDQRFPGRRRLPGGGRLDALDALTRGREQALDPSCLHLRHGVMIRDRARRVQPGAAH